jgi:uncharacterized protein (DUF305 family)
MAVTSALICALAVAAEAQSAQYGHAHPRASMTQPPAPYVASTAKSFPQLMDNAMAVMDAGMRSAPMNGEPEHDFVTMMIPHHQGAVDMAKALLLNTNDRELRNLAQGIITEQENEIRLMQAWLARHGKGHTDTDSPKPVSAAPAIPQAR